VKREVFRDKLRRWNTLIVQHQNSVDGRTVDVNGEWGIVAVTNGKYMHMFNTCNVTNLQCSDCLPSTNHDKVLNIDDNIALGFW